ncbi:MAG: hypothetical protein GY909_05115 [Oligoflexia bacterium]|nr:hypothetical protein [Oligoflexia bacterium]
MLLCKFNVVLLTLLLSLNISAFSDNECLKSTFQVTISHKGQPFGLAKNVLHIDKSACILKISHQKLKFINKSWMIDVCREPVHIKNTKGAVQIIKKTKECSGKATDEFCSKYNTIRMTIQDDGLIFAEGEKENIESDHGKVYCSYQLLNAYLDNSFVFSSSKDYEGILSGKNIKKVERVEIISNQTEPAVNSAPRPVMEGADNSEENKSNEAPIEPAPVTEEKKEDPKTTTF